MRILKWSVSEYKYLGVLFNYNGRFKKGEMLLKDKANRAMYSAIGMSRKYDLPVDIQVELFNMMVVPVVTLSEEKGRKGVEKGYLW